MEDERLSLRVTPYIRVNLEYILVNNLSEHNNKSDFVRGAVVKEIRRLLENNKKGLS